MNDLFVINLRGLDIGLISVYLLFSKCNWNVPMDHTFKLLIFVKIGTREIFSLKLYFLDIDEILVQLDYLQAKKPYIHLRTTGS